MTLDDSNETVSYTILLDMRPSESPEEEQGDTVGSVNNSTETSNEEMKYTNLPPEAVEEAKLKEEAIKQISESVNSFRGNIRTAKEIKAKLGGKRYVEPEAPRLSIDKTLQNGLMEISFSEDIQIVPNVTMITNGTVTVDEKVYPVLEIEIVPGEDSDEEMLGYTWRAVSQTNRTLVVQFEFENALFISANGDRERVKVTVRDPVMFTGTNGL